jgi:hypothetical protein
VWEFFALGVMESQDLQIRVFLDATTSIPVKISPFATGLDCISLLTSLQLQVDISELIHSQRLLNHSLSLRSQGVEDGDVIVALTKSKPAAPQPPEDLTTPDHKIIGLWHESLRIFDDRFLIFERTRHPLHSYRQMLASREEANPTVYPTDDEKTAIPLESGKGPSTGPLPMVDDDSDFDDGDWSSDGSGDETLLSMFGSIEEAGKFFGKFPWREWTW